MTDNSSKQYIITVTGKVQRVGFRDKVEDLAIEHRIKGYVQNIKTREVSIVAEGLDSNLKNFCAALKNCEPPVMVSTINIEERPVLGTYEDFTILRGEPIEELAERFDTAIFYLHSIDTKQDQMLGKQDVMIELQKETLGLQKHTIELQEHTIELQEHTIELQENSVSIQNETLNEIRAVKSTVSNTFMQELSELRTEVRDMRNELIKAGVITPGHIGNG